jgi:hypothetical protein
VSANDRLKRPRLERVQPIRSWSTLFKAPTADGSGTNSADNKGGASLQDVVSRSVELGYRVVDEYVRQGQKAAQRLNDRSYGVQAIAGDAQDLAMRMLEHASDFAAVWLEFVQIAAAGNATASSSAGEDAAKTKPDERPNAAAPASRSKDASPERLRVRIEMLSTQPTEVSLDINPDAARLPLIVHALRAVDPDKPRLSEVSFEAGADKQPGCLRIHVPPGQPAGIYSGLMIDEQTSRPVGSVSVRVA